MQSAKYQEKSLELYFWQFLLRYLSKKELLDQTVKKVWPLLTAEQLLGMESFAESNESVSATCLRRPPKFNEFESWLTKVSIQDIQYSFGKRLLIYCVFRIGLKVAIELVFPSNGKGVSEKKTQSVPYADWGPHLIPLMAGALASAPNQDPVQTLISLATQQVKKLKAAAVTTTIPPASSSTTTTSTSLPVAPLEKREEKKETKSIQATVVDSGPLIKAMNQPVQETSPQPVSPSSLASDRKAEVNDFISRFWRDVGVAGNEEARLKFSDSEAPWFRPIIEKMFGSVDQATLTRQTVLFGKLYFLYQHISQAYPNGELILFGRGDVNYEVMPAPAFSGEAHVISITQVYKQYQLPGLSETRSFSEPVQVVAKITIQENPTLASDQAFSVTSESPVAQKKRLLTQEDYFQEEILSVSLTKADAEILRLQEYLEWFRQELQRFHAEAKRLETLFSGDAEKLSSLDVPRLVRGIQEESAEEHKPSVDETILSQYTGSTPYLTALAQLAQATEQYGANSAIRERVRTLHEMYAKNQHKCLHIQSQRKPAVDTEKLLQAQPLPPEKITFGVEDMPAHVTVSLHPPKQIQSNNRGLMGINRAVSAFVPRDSIKDTYLARDGVKNTKSKEDAKEKEAAQEAALAAAIGQDVYGLLKRWEYYDQQLQQGKADAKQEGSGICDSYLTGCAGVPWNLFNLSGRRVYIDANGEQSAVKKIAGQSTLVFSTIYDRFQLAGSPEDAVSYTTEGAKVPFQGPVVCTTHITSVEQEGQLSFKAANISIEMSSADAASLQIDHALTATSSVGQELRFYQQALCVFSLEQLSFEGLVIPQAEPAFADSESCCQGFLKELDHYFPSLPNVKDAKEAVLLRRPRVKSIDSSSRAELFGVSSTDTEKMDSGLFGEQAGQAEPSEMKASAVKPVAIARVEAFSISLWRLIDSQCRQGESIPQNLWAMLLNWLPTKTTHSSLKLSRILVVVEQTRSNDESIPDEQHTALYVDYMLPGIIWPMTVHFDITALDAPVVLDVTLHTAHILQLGLVQQLVPFIPATFKEQARQEELFWQYLQWHLGTTCTRAQAIEQARAEKETPEYKDFIVQFKHIVPSEEEGLLLYGAFKASEQDVVAYLSAEQQVMFASLLEETAAGRAVLESPSKPVKPRRLPFSMPTKAGIKAGLSKLFVKKRTADAKEMADARPQTPPTITVQAPTFSSVLRGHLIVSVATAMQEQGSAIDPSRVMNADISSSSLSKSRRRASNVASFTVMLGRVRELAAGRIQQLQAVFVAAAATPTPSILITSDSMVSSVSYEDMSSLPSSRSMSIVGGGGDGVFPLLEQSREKPWNVTEAFQSAQEQVLQGLDMSDESKALEEMPKKNRILRDLQRYAGGSTATEAVIVIGGMPFLPNKTGDELLAALQNNLRVAGIPETFISHIVRNLHEGGYGGLFNGFFTVQLKQQDINIANLNTAKLYIDYDHSQRAVIITQEARTADRIDVPKVSTVASSSHTSFSNRRWISKPADKPGKASSPFLLGLGGVCRLTRRQDGQLNCEIDKAFVYAYHKGDKGKLINDIHQEVVEKFKKSLTTEPISLPAPNRPRGLTQAAAPPPETVVNLQSQLEMQFELLKGLQESTGARNLDEGEQFILNTYLENPEYKLDSSRLMYERMLVAIKTLDLTQASTKAAVRELWNLYQQNYQLCWRIYSAQKQIRPSERSLRNLIFWRNVQWWSHVFSRPGVLERSREVEKFRKVYPVVKSLSSPDLLFNVFTESRPFPVEQSTSAAASSQTTVSSIDSPSAPKKPFISFLQKPKEKEFKATELSSAISISIEKQWVGMMVGAIGEQAVSVETGAGRLKTLAQKENSKLLRELFVAEDLHSGSLQDFIWYGSVATLEVSANDVGQKFSFTPEAGQTDLRQFYRAHSVELSKLSGQVLGKDLVFHSALYVMPSPECFEVRHRYQAKDLQHPVYLQLTMSLEDGKIGIAWRISISQWDALAIKLQEKLVPTSAAYRVLQQLPFMQITLSGMEWQASFPESKSNRPAKEADLNFWLPRCFNELTVSQQEQRRTQLEKVLRWLPQFLPATLELTVGDMRVLKTTSDQQILSIYYTQWQAKDTGGLLDDKVFLALPIEVQFDLTNPNAVRVLWVKFLNDERMRVWFLPHIKLNNPVTNKRSPLDDILSKPSSRLLEYCFWQQLHKQVSFQTEAWQKMLASPAEKKLEVQLYQAVVSTAEFETAVSDVIYSAQLRDKGEAMVDEWHDQNDVKATFSGEHKTEHRSISTPPPVGSYQPSPSPSPMDSLMLARSSSMPRIIRGIRTSSRSSATGSSDTGADQPIMTQGLVSEPCANYLRQQLRGVIEKAGDLQQNLLELAAARVSELDPLARIEIPLDLATLPAAGRVASSELCMQEFWGNLGTVVEEGGKKAVPRSGILAWVKKNHPWFEEVAKQLHQDQILGNSYIVKPYWDWLDQIVRRKTHVVTTVEYTKEFMGVVDEPTVYVVNHVIAFSHYTPSSHLSSRFATAMPVELFLSMRFKKDLLPRPAKLSDIVTIQAKLHISQEDAQRFGIPCPSPLKRVSAAPYPFYKETVNYPILERREKAFPQLCSSNSQINELKKYIAIFQEAHAEWVATSLTGEQPIMPRHHYLPVEAGGNNYLSKLNGLLPPPQLSPTIDQEFLTRQQQRLAYAAYGYYDKNRQFALQLDLGDNQIQPKTAVYLTHVTGYLEKESWPDAVLNECFQLEKVFWERSYWHAQRPDYAMYYLFEPLMLAADGYPELPEEAEIIAFVKKKEDYLSFIQQFPFSQFDEILQLQLYSVFAASLRQALIAHSKSSPAARDLAKRLLMQQWINGLVKPPYDNLNALKTFAANNNNRTKNFFNLVPRVPAPRSNANAQVSTNAAGFLNRPSLPGVEIKESKRSETKEVKVADQKTTRNVIFCDFDDSLRVNKRGSVKLSKTKTSSTSIASQSDDQLDKGREILEEQKASAAKNCGWLHHLLSLVPMGGEVTVALGSSRYNLGSDLEHIYGRGEKDSAYFPTMVSFVSAANQYFQQTNKNVKLTLDDFSMADIACRLRPGQSAADAIAYYGENPKRVEKKPLQSEVKAAAESKSKPQTPPRDFILKDPSKVLHLYAAMQRAALATPEQHINFYVTDDMSSILGNAWWFFQVHPNWIPRNVTLCLRRYVPRDDDRVQEKIRATNPETGDLEDLSLAPIRGIGRVDARYADTVRDMSNVLQRLSPQAEQLSDFPFNPHEGPSAFDLLMLLSYGREEISTEFQFKLPDMLFSSSSQQILDYMEANKVLVSCCVNLAKVGKEQDSLLAHAIRYSASSTVIQALLKAGADPFVASIVGLSAKKAPTPQSSALHVAVACANVAAITLLLQDLDPQRREELLLAKDSQGNTALHLAVALTLKDAAKGGLKDTREPFTGVVGLLVGHLEILQLKQRGCGVEKNQAGETPFDMVCNTPIACGSLKKLVCNAQGMLVSLDARTPSSSPDSLPPPDDGGGGMNRSPSLDNLVEEARRRTPPTPPRKPPSPK